jgi:hypothetical protein
MVPIASRGISFSIETAASSFHTVCLCLASTTSPGPLHPLARRFHRDPHWSARILGTPSQ